MEASVIIPMWQVIVYAVFFASSYAVIAYMTRRNTKEIEDIKKSYVSSELYKNEVNHINNTLDEIKGQNTQILAMLASKSN
ncbi:hypothetical protein [Sulfurimonas sp.]